MDMKLSGLSMLTTCIQLKTSFYTYVLPRQLATELTPNLQPDRAFCFLRLSFAWLRRNSSKF